MPLSPDLKDPSIITLTIGDSGRVLRHNTAAALLETLLVAGEDVATECGGGGICGSCGVRIPAHAPAAQEDDYDLLGDAAVDAGWRLSCQCHPSEDAVIEIDRSADSHAMVIQTTGREILDSGPPETGSELGLALDLGTTTIVGYITCPGEENDLIVAFPNPQRLAGADVISRIAYAHDSVDALARLATLVKGQIERRVGEALAERDLSASDISHITVAGNMTMAHLFVGADPWSLGVAPYQPAFTSKPVMKASELGFKTFTNADILLVPGIAGHLGGDTVAGLYALDLMATEDTVLFLDLGTNGEIVLVHDGRAVGCSCAAGPAFEGVKISCGMPAVPGAINEVSIIDGDLAFVTFGDHSPIGLCGSGLADLVDALLSAGLVEPGGRILRPDELPETTPPDLANRIQTKGSNGRQRAIRIAEGAHDHILCLTQADIREVQLAKAAFRAGIECLCQRANISTETIGTVYVAGGFGNALKTDALVALGILPATLQGRIQPVGNIAGAGARKALQRDRDGSQCQAISDWVEHFPLESAPDFATTFTAELGFPGSVIPQTDQR